MGLAAVDRSVFILAENRLNLQQVFDELERLYQKPQAELHEARPLNKTDSPGRRGRLPGRRRGGDEQQERARRQGIPRTSATRAAASAAAPSASARPCQAQPRPCAAANGQTRQPRTAWSRHGSAGGWPRCSGFASSSPRPGSGTDLTTDASGKASKQLRGAGQHHHLDAARRRALQETGLGHRRGAAEGLSAVLRPVPTCPTPPSAASSSR